SLVDWSITEQQELFTVFGENADKIMVNLSETSLMYPVKSVSGIRYPSKKEFKNCELCQRKNCPTRESEFDQDLFIKTLHE
ncbi:MAG: vitamin B12 dependent methionine synthase, partial [Clostridiales bacterium]